MDQQIIFPRPPSQGQCTPISKRPPRQFYFTPGYACNSDCVMCGVAKWKRDEKAKFSLEYSYSLIDRMQLTPIDILEFSGGEPTIYKGFLDLVRYAKKRYNPRIMVLSHGRSMAKQSFVEKLKDLDVERYVVPLFSNIPDVHDQITGAPGSFEETIRGFDNLYAAGIPFTIKFIAMRPNHMHALDVYHLKSQRWSGASFIVSGYQLMGEAITNEGRVAARHSEIAPSIELVLEAAERQCELVPVFMFPLCLIDAAYWGSYGVGVWREEVVAPDQHQIEQSSELNYESKPDRCAPCAMKNRCTWAWKKYVERYGTEELNPING